MPTLPTSPNGAVSVAYVSPAWPLGTSANGVVTYTTHLVSALRGMGHQPYVLALDRDANSDEPFVLDAWADRGSRRLGTRLVDFLCHKVAARRWWSRSLAASLGVRVEHLVRDVGLSLIEIEEAFGVAGHLVGRSAIPVVVRLHGPWCVVAPSMGLGTDANTRRRIRAEGRALGAAAAVSAPSQDVVQRVREYYGIELPHAQVIPNPIAPVAESNRWSLTACEPDRILFVGRFDRCKGIDIILDAFARVGAAHPSCRLTLVGPDRGFVDGAGRRWSAEDYLSTKPADGAIRRRVEWLGVLSQSRIAELRRRCGVTVVCSRYENFPMVVLEAMAFGSPLVATRVGGIPEMIQDGRNGLLCRPEDAGDLAGKILTLMGDPDLAARLGSQACLDVEERYHPRVIAERMLAFYRNVIDGVEDAHRRETGGYPAR